jgi:hypothetical protein
MDGVRQDFIIEQRPVGAGTLRVELEVAGAKVGPLADGARLVLENSGRKIAYSRLCVTDATGKELNARMEVMGSACPSYLVSGGQGESPSQSARGLAQSKTLRAFQPGESGRQLLECASPLSSLPEKSCAEHLSVKDRFAVQSHHVFVWASPLTSLSRLALPARPRRLFGALPGVPRQGL